MISSVSLFLALASTPASAFMGTSLIQQRNAFRPMSSRSSALTMVADDAKVILVTGSSRGLGKSIALELGKHGQKVIINYVSDGSKEAAEATVEEIKALGGDAIALQADSTFFSTRQWSFMSCRLTGRSHTPFLL